jgi:hypothetical protein
VTRHGRAAGGGADTYVVGVIVNGQRKLPVAGTLFSGPNVQVPFDLPVNQVNIDVHGSFGMCGGASFDLGTTVPQIGDAYRTRLTFHDGTTGDVTAAVETVLDTFARNLGETVTSPYSRNVPLFTWSAPVSPPAGHFYWVSVTGPDATWTTRRLPSGTTSVVYGTGGNAPPSLTTGVTYTYRVVVEDPLGNTAEYGTTYTP